MKINFVFYVLVILLIGCGDSTLSRKDNLSMEVAAENQTSYDRSEIDAQKLMKNANVRFRTADIDETYNKIKDSLKEFNAFISSENNFNYDNQTGYDLTIKVPANNFEGLLNFIVENANIRKLDNKSVQVRDVTEEFIDIQARLRIKKEAQQRLSELLKQTKNVTEILEVHKEMTELLAEIESIEGRLKYLTDQTDYSYINLSFYETSQYSFRFFSEFWNALKEGWQLFLHLVTWLAYLWVIIIVGLLTFGGIKIYKRRKSKKK